MIPAARPAVPNATVRINPMIAAVVYATIGTLIKEQSFAISRPMTRAFMPPALR